MTEGILVLRGTEQIGDQGPTVIDCGLWCQLALWMGIRYLVGDVLFDELIDLKETKFTLTCNYYGPISEDGTDGNLLSMYYDRASAQDRPRAVLTKAIFNDPRYIYKHPGGMNRLENVVQVGDVVIAFFPGEKCVLTMPGLEDRLLTAYNANQSSSALENISIYKRLPDHHLVGIPREMLGELAIRAEELAYHTISEEEWEDGRISREKEADNLELVFQTSRLIQNLQRVSKGECVQLPL